MSALDPRIETIRQTYGLDKADFWELPQKKGTWLVKHAALEVAAAKAGISFDMPQAIEAHTGEGIAVMCVRGFTKDRSEWATGEATPKNNKNSYPWAMAEKRAKDRVILKLIGIHGLVYSEDEMGDEAKGEPSAATNTTRMSSDRAKKVLNFDGMLKEIDNAKTLTVLDNWDEFYRSCEPWFPGGWVARLLERIAECRHGLESEDPATIAAVSANESLDRQYRETVG